MCALIGIYVCLYIFRIYICFKSFKILHFDTMCNRMTSLNKILNNNIYSILIILPLRQVISHKMRTAHTHIHTLSITNTHVPIRMHCSVFCVLCIDSYYVYILQSMKIHLRRTVIHLYIVVVLYIWHFFFRIIKRVSCMLTNTH